MTIQAVQSFKATNLMSANSKHAQNVTFKGNPLSLVKDELMLSDKISKNAEGIAETISKKVKGLTDEMPATKKSKTAAIIDPTDAASGALYKDPKQVAGAIADNVILGPTKFSVASQAAAIGAGIGGPIGAGVAFIGTYALWGLIRKGLIKVMDP